MNCSTTSPTPTRTSSSRRWRSSSSRSKCCSIRPRRSGSAAWLARALPRARPWRFVAFTYLVFLAMMMAMHAKDYYLAPIYPVLFAAGAVALRPVHRRDSAQSPIGCAMCSGLICLAPGPSSCPSCRRKNTSPTPRPSAPTSSRSREVHQPAAANPLRPLRLAGDGPGIRRPLQRAAARCARAHGNFLRQLRRGKRGRIFSARKYGLPTAISGHQNYFYWGWNGYTGESMLTLGNNARITRTRYAEVIDLGPFDEPWTMDFEHLHYFWLRHRKVPYAADWPTVKFWG